MERALSLSQVTAYTQPGSLQRAVGLICPYEVNGRGAGPYIPFEIKDFDEHDSRWGGAAGGLGDGAVDYLD